MRKYFLWMVTAMLVMMAGATLTACNENDEEGINNYQVSGIKEDFPETPTDLDNINMLYIQSEGGSTEICPLNQCICGISGQIYVTGSDNTHYIDYPMKFTATIKNSAHFTGLHLGIENRENRKIEDMAVGTSYSTFHFNPYNKLSSSIWGDTYKPAYGAWSGGIKVVGKRTDPDGTAYITIRFQNLENCVYDQYWNQHTYFLNGVIEFRIGDNGIYPQQEKQDKDVNVEPMLMPSDELDFFMMDALHGDETQGRRTFFSDTAEEEKLLIINSEEEFRAAYKGNKEMPSTGINFDNCSLVIGRTYGEHGGVSLADFDLTDKGDNYQLDVTLNNNTNPNYYYTAAFVDLYFWKIYPKMEQKPVVFNRIRQDVNIDPLEVYNRIKNRWILQSYSDADGTSHQVSNGRGDEHYSIELMENGRMGGNIGKNEISCTYMLGYVGKRAYYEDIDHGVINLWNWAATKVNDDDPVSQQFMRISSATQFKLASSLSLTLYVSPEEWFCFRREGL